MLVQDRSVHCSSFGWLLRFANDISLLSAPGGSSLIRWTCVTLTNKLQWCMIYPLPWIEVFDDARWHRSLVRRVAGVSSGRDGDTTSLTRSETALQARWKGRRVPSPLSMLLLF